MDFAGTALLGAVAGFTIFLGLPLGRVGHVDDRVRVALAMFSVGILAFIFMDVSSHGQEIVAGTMNAFKEHRTGFAHVLGQFALLAVGFVAGTAGISAIERGLRNRGVRGPVMAGGEAQAALSPQEIAMYAPGSVGARQRALRTGMTIAAAIGLHNFAEGLAIGVSAKAGAIGLATVLIIGFSLHNATEGFGIVGPLGNVRPSWGWLGLAGLIGGAPTFLGAIVGYQVQSDGLELAFYALAGGAILYVVGEIWTGMRRYGYRTLGLYMIAAGFLLGVATDLIVTYGGA
jgi:ZIP family zinc transporter